MLQYGKMNVRIKWLNEKVLNYKLNRILKLLVTYIMNCYLKNLINNIK